MNEPSRDPHFSEMPALDSTVGDYSQPDLLPPETPRRSYEAASLRLVSLQDQPALDVRLSETAVRIAGDVK